MLCTCCRISVILGKEGINVLVKGDFDDRVNLRNIRYLFIEYVLFCFIIKGRFYLKNVNLGSVLWYCG